VRRAEAAEDVVVRDAELRSTTKVLFQDFDGTHRRIRRGWKTSDRKCRTKMALPISLGEARREKPNFLGVD